MKINKLRFKNLNSLAGEWVIDFTCSEYIEQGIFAITGPTGAGKSTILDAICLALYGQTPRLGAITKTKNEIMSRQSGECFAELEFTTLNGKYRVFWEQSRSRKKAEGNLQNVKRELADLTNQQILDSQINTVNSRIVELTGMDFDHFTRAMLLAQGSFAKFLQATPDERSPILEQITGSQIYSEISKKVHEYKVVQERKLELTRAKLSGITLLSKEEVTGLEEQLSHYDKQQAQLLVDKSTYETQLQWLNEIANLRLNLQLVIDKQAKLILDEDNFAAQDSLLEKAMKAQQLNGEIYQQLIGLRKQTRQITSSLQQELLKLPGLSEQHQLAKDQLAAQQILVSEHKEHCLTQTKLIQQVRQFDTQLVDATQQLSKLKKSINDLQAEELLLESLRHAKANELVEQQRQLVSKTQYLTEIATDGELLTKLSGITRNLENLNQLFSDKEGLLNQLAATQEECDKLTLTHEQLKLQEQQLATLISHQQAEAQKLAGNESASSLNTALANLSQQRVSLTEERQLLTKLRHLLDEHEVTLADLACGQDNRQKKQQQYEPLLPQLSSLEKQISVCKEFLASLNYQLILENKILDLIDEREKLRDNQPCPLCGSLEHPYAHVQFPGHSDTEEKISKHTAQLEGLQQQQLALNQQITSLTIELVELDKNNSLLGTRLAEELSMINQQAKCLGFTLETDLIALVNCVDIAENDYTTKMAQLDELTSQLLARQQQLEALNVKIGANQKDHSLLMNRLTASVANLAAKQDQLASLITDLAKQEERTNSLWQILAAELAVYGVMLEKDSIVAIQLQLQKRLDNWTQQQQCIARLQETINELNQQVSKAEIEAASLQKQLKLVNEELTSQHQVYQEIKQERYKLFADNDVAEHEKILQAKDEAIGQQLRALQTEFYQLEQRLTTTQQLILSYQQQLTPLNAELILLEESFRSKSILAGFSDEAAFTNSLLAPEFLLQLKQHKEQLTQRNLELATEHKQLTSRLAIAEAKQLTTESDQELTLQLEILTKQLGTINQSIGSIKMRLQNDQESYAQQLSIINEMECQQLETSRWQQLHNLIGSADGKKFRNFAQGLTFELAVRNANLQLQKMSARYLLIRDKDAPLELNVIDNFQGGEIRTSKNLSGGESFVISLALALGLSRLSSNKMQVDSLFLDEGFGTLDEDSLQTALDALASLQQEGKLIGVISHVGALKERIGLQIQVEPLSGGISKINGVGCQRLSSGQ